MRKLSVHSKRVFCAIVVICASCLAVFVVQACLDGYKLSSSLKEGSNYASESFSKDVCDMQDFATTDFREAVDGHIFSMCTNTQLNEAFQKLRELLEASDWSFITGSADTPSTFVKNSGTYTWLLMSLTHVGDSTTIVIEVN